MVLEFQVDRKFVRDGGIDFYVNTLFVINIMIILM